MSWLSRVDSFASLFGRAADGLRPDRGCLFTFHRAAPECDWAGLPNRNFYLDLGFLDRLLAYIKQIGWSVVTLDEALCRAASPHGGRFVNFSIDDCYRDTWEHVVPLFRRHGVPVTLFVTTGIPDATLPLWGAGLETILLGRETVMLDGVAVGVPTAAEKREAFERISRLWDGPTAASRYAAFCAENGTDPVTLDREHAITWDMLDALRADPLVEIGAHTVSHARISSLAAEDALAELAGSRQRLQARLGIAARHMAFPYGRSGDCGPRDFALARDAGFASAATTRKGLVGADQDPYCLPRVTLNGAHRSLLAIQAHLTGLTGLAAQALGRV